MEYLFMDLIKKITETIKKYYNEILFLGISLFFAPLYLFSNLLRQKCGFGKSGFCGKILVIQAAKLGDMVCSTPIFREIKKEYPNSYLIAACLKRVAPILQSNPHINEIIHIDDFIYGGFCKRIKFVYKIKKEKIASSLTLMPSVPGIIIPLWAMIPEKIITTSQYAGRLHKIISLFYKDKLEYKRHTLTVSHYLDLLKFIGINADNRKKELFFSGHDEIFVNDFFRRNNLTGKELSIGAAVTAGNVLKEWSPEKFAELFDKLINELGARIIVVGSKGDKKKISYIQSIMKNEIHNTAGLFTLPQLSYFLSKMKLFVSVDTGPLYMANAVGTPVVNIAGPIDIREQPPLGEKCAIVQKKLDCVPCSFTFPPTRKCRNREKLKCLKIITVDDVFRGIIKLIKEEKIWNV